MPQVWAEPQLTPSPDPGLSNTPPPTPEPVYLQGRNEDGPPACTVRPASSVSTVGTLQPCPPLPPQLHSAPGILPQAVFASLPGNSSFTVSPMMLQVLEKSTPVCTSSCSSLSLTPPGVFSASKQREVHLAGPADGAHAAGAQVSPPSPGARVGAPRQGLGLSPSPCHRRGAERSSRGWGLAPSGRKEEAGRPGLSGGSPRGEGRPR